jgi:hypothetical protein
MRWVLLVFLTAAFFSACTDEFGRFVFEPSGGTAGASGAAPLAGAAGAPLP